MNDFHIEDELECLLWNKVNDKKNKDMDTKNEEKLR